MIQEIDLVKALKDQNEKNRAFRTLVSVYKERLYWHIRKIVINHDDADDVLQNTFIKVFRNINSFKGDSKLYTWMYRIATNEALSFVSKRAKHANITSEAVRDRALASLESDVYFEGDTIQLHLQKAIASLPQKQQLVFSMKYFEEHTFEELSEILDTSVGGLKSSYHIAVKKVTEFLKNNETF